MDSHEEFASEFETFNVHSISVSDQATMDGLRHAALKCPTYQEIIKYFKDGSKIVNCPSTHPAKQFRNIWHEISFEDGLLVFNKKIIIPHSYQRNILKALHKNHMGFTKCYEIARKYYFWTSMKNDLQQMIDNCDSCITHSRFRPILPPIPTVATKPMEHFSVDLCDYNGRKFLIQCDRFSGYLFVNPMIKTTTDRVVNAQKSVFNFFGFPECLRSDNGPPFNSSDYATFCRTYNINHQFSDPYYPESNGHAERAVGIAKEIIKKSPSIKDLQDLVQQYNNAPLSDGLSPSEWMFGRSQRFHLPTLESGVRVGEDHLLRKEEKKFQNFDLRNNKLVQKSRPTPPLSIGDNVKFLLPKN